MPKYINADEIDYKIIYYPHLDFYTGTVHTEQLDGVYALKTDIDAMPAAYVREVKCGKWLTDRFGMERAICSICGAVYEGGNSFRFCPKCGAKMDLDDDK